MNRKLVPIIITLLMVIGSFGAVGTENTDDENYCGCGNTSTHLSYNLGDGDYSLGLNEDYFVDGPVDECKPRFCPEDATNFDWRNPDKNSEGRNCVTPVRNQRNCGSCWAFATVAPVESKIMIQHNTEFDISERWLVSNCCSAGDCNGGWWALDWYKKDKDNVCDGDFGTVKEDDLPYSDGNYGHGESCNCDLTFYYDIDNWAYVQNRHDVAETDNIKQAIMEHGPVCVAVYVDSAFQSYNGGVFRETYSGNSINHGVTLVGWDDNKGNGCWILKNSWGRGWGENGYMYIEYGANQVGYAAAYVGNVIPKVPPETGKPKITIDVGKIQDIDAIEGIGCGDPEWYYVMTVTESDGDTHTIKQQNKDDNLNWIEESEWDLSADLDENNNKKHRYFFEVDSQTVDISVKVMEADWDLFGLLDLDDIADVSPVPDPDYEINPITGLGSYDNVGSSPSKRIEDRTVFRTTYNICEMSSISPASSGIDDGSTDVDENDAYIEFNEIKDDYSLPSGEIDGDPSKAVKGVERSFKAKVVSGTHGPFEYEWDFSYDGNTFNVEGTGETVDNSWSSTGTYTVGMRVKDNMSWYSENIVTTEVTVEENQPPSTPTISGPSSSQVNPGNHEFTFKSTDPNQDGDKVYYMYKVMKKKLGDDEVLPGYPTDWLGPYEPGVEQGFTINLPDEKTTYIVTAKARDESEVESDWSSYEQPTPKLKDKNIVIEPLFRQLLKLLFCGYPVFEVLLVNL